MQSADYLRRMETILSARVEEKQAKDAPRFLRTRRALTAIAGAAACFFVLKAASLAYSDQPPSAPLAAEAGFAAQVHHWIAGADPISRTLAAALRNDTGILPGMAASAI